MKEGYTMPSLLFTCFLLKGWVFLFSQSFANFGRSGDLVDLVVHSQDSMIMVIFILEMEKCVRQMSSVLVSLGRRNKIQ